MNSCIPRPPARLCALGGRAPVLDRRRRHQGRGLFRRPGLDAPVRHRGASCSSSGIGGSCAWTSWTAAAGLAYAATLTLFVAATKLTTAANAIFLQSTAPLYIVVLGAVAAPRAGRRAAISAYLRGDGGGNGRSVFLVKPSSDDDRAESRDWAT